MPLINTITFKKNIRTALEIVLRRSNRTRIAMLKFKGGSERFGS